MNIPAFGAVGRHDAASLIFQGPKKLEALDAMANDSTIPPAQAKFNDGVVDYLGMVGEAARASLVALQAQGIR